MKAFADDISSICDPNEVEEVSVALINSITALGLEVNVGKSSVYCTSPTNGTTFAQAERSAPFVVLGADMCVDDSVFCAQYTERQRTFFNTLQKVDIHPQLLFALLRCCGSPRLLYFCATTPPSVESTKVTTEFQQMQLHALAKLIGCDPRSLPHTLVHCSQGAGFPDYTKCHEQLYKASKSMSLSRSRSCQAVELVTNHQLPATTPDVRAQHSADYLFFRHPVLLTPLQFSLALGIRMRTLPSIRSRTPLACICGHNSLSDADIIEHACNCDKMGITFTDRHNRVRDAVARVAHGYNVWTTSEPTCFAYEQGQKNRPDMIFHLAKSVVTDFTVVNSAGDAGLAAAAAAKAKIDKHKKAVEALDMTFIPCAMEIFGHMDESVTQMIQAISSQLPFHHRYNFNLDMRHAISSALAINRNYAIMNATRHDLFGWM
jgi:hypothetical protein